MKRIDLVRHLERNGCELLREGGNHSENVNRAVGKVSAVPRHREINELLALKSAATWVSLSPDRESVLHPFRPPIPAFLSGSKVTEIRQSTEIQRSPRARASCLRQDTKAGVVPQLPGPSKSRAAERPLLRGPYQTGR